MRKKYLSIFIGGLLLIILTIVILVFVNINNDKKEYELQKEQELVKEKEDQEKKKRVEERRQNNKIYKDIIETFAIVIGSYNDYKVRDNFYANSIDYRGVLAWQNVNWNENKFNEEYIQVEDALPDWSRASNTMLGGHSTIQTFFMSLIEEKSKFKLEFDDSIKYSELENNEEIHIVKTTLNIKAIRKDSRFIEQDMEKQKEFTFVFYKGKIIDIQLSDRENRKFSLFYYFTNKDFGVKTTGSYINTNRNSNSNGSSYTSGILVSDFYKSYKENLIEFMFKDNGEVVLALKDETTPYYEIKGTYKIEDSKIKILLNSESSDEPIELEAHIRNNIFYINSPANSFRYYMND